MEREKIGGRSCFIRNGAFGHDLLCSVQLLKYTIFWLKRGFMDFLKSFVGAGFSLFFFSTKNFLC